MNKLMILLVLFSSTVYGQVSSPFPFECHETALAAASFLDSNLFRDQPQNINRIEGKQKLKSVALKVTFQKSIYDTSTTRRYEIEIIKDRSGVLVGRNQLEETGCKIMSAKSNP